MRGRWVLGPVIALVAAASAAYVQARAAWTTDTAHEAIRSTMVAEGTSSIILYPTRADTSRRMYAVGAITSYGCGTRTSGGRGKPTGLLIDWSRVTSVAVVTNYGVRIYGGLTQDPVESPLPDAYVPMHGPNIAARARKFAEAGNFLMRSCAGKTFAALPQHTFSTPAPAPAAAAPPPRPAPPPAPSPYAQCTTTENRCRSQCRSRQASEIGAGLGALGSGRTYYSRFNMDDCVAKCRDDSEICREDIKAEQDDKRAAARKSAADTEMYRKAEQFKPSVVYACSSNQQSFALEIWEAQGLCRSDGLLTYCNSTQPVVRYFLYGMSFSFNRMTGQLLRSWRVGSSNVQDNMTCQRADPSLYK